MVFSIIIPVYNVEKYLEACLDTVFCQKFTKDEFEVICVDDGSTDRSAQILERYGLKYHNLVIIHKNNEGVAAARNAGMLVAHGDYIWFIDSDDIVAENALQTIHEAINKSSSKPDRLKFGSWACYENITKDEIKDIQKNSKPNYDYNNTVVWNCCFKREFLITHDIVFNSKMSYSEDTLFTAVVLAKGAISKDISDILYFHRYNPSSLLASYDSVHNEKRIESWIEALMTYRSIAENKSVYSQQIEISFNQMIFKTLAKVMAFESEKEEYYLKLLHKKELFPCKLYRHKIVEKENDQFNDRPFYSFLYNHLNTYWGYYTLKLFKRIASIKRRIKNR